MEDWLITFNATFFITILGLLVGVCYKSKCREVTFCSNQGMMHIVRDVDAEIDRIPDASDV